MISMGQLALRLFQSPKWQHGVQNDLLPITASRDNSILKLCLWRS